MAGIKKNNTETVKKNDMKIIKEYATDVVKSVLVWVIVTGLAFLYWMAVLLIMSLILLNVWHVTFDSVLKYAIILTVITSFVYVAKKIYKLKK